MLFLFFICSTNEMFIQTKRKGKKMVKKLREIMAENLEFQGVIFIEDSDKNNPCLKPAIKKADLANLSEEAKAAIGDFVEDFLERHSVKDQPICILQNLYDILKPIGRDDLIGEILWPQEKIV